MARPRKIGLDYFPMDTHNSTELKLLIAHCGYEGFFVYIGLLQRLFAEKGYYLTLDEESMVLIADNMHVDIKQFKWILNFIFKQKLFDEKLFIKYSILTSKHIQEVYLYATARRTSTYIDERYDLVGKRKGAPENKPPDAPKDVFKLNKKFSSDISTAPSYDIEKLENHSIFDD